MLKKIHKYQNFLPHKWDADEILQIIRFWRPKRFIKLQHVGYEWILVSKTEHTGNYSVYQRGTISLQHISSNIHKLWIRINTTYKLHTKWWHSLKGIYPLYMEMPGKSFQQRHYCQCLIRTLQMLLSELWNIDGTDPHDSRTIKTKPDSLSHNFRRVH
jgi:hypothetical protein